MQSLEDLGTDYIDLFLIHWPITNDLQAWETFIKLYEEKRLRAIGVSNFEPHQLKVLEDHGLLTPMVNQIEMHPKFQQRTVKPYSESRGMVIEAWSPLGGSDALLINEPVILKIAEKHGKTGAQVIIRWHLQVGNVVIPKSIRRERIIENSKVFDFILDQEDMAAIAALDTGKRIYWDPYRWEK
jgi:diketogulonate reductase-like aldo/keto reductase